MHSLSSTQTENRSAGKFTRVVDFLPVLLLLLIGTINGVFYKAVAINKTAQLIVILNFSFSALIILYCIRKGFLFSRKCPETAQRSPADAISKRRLEKVELPEEERVEFLNNQDSSSKEAAEYANIFLN